MLTGPWRRSAAPVCACALIFTGHLFYGANTNASALVFAAAWLIFGGITAGLNESVLQTGRSALLIMAGVLFAGTVAVTACQLLPAAGFHPLWATVDGAHAGTLDRDATRLEIVKLISLAAAFVVGLGVGTSERRLRLFVFATLVATALYAAWAFMQNFADFARFMGGQKPYHEGRLTASFLSANSAATLFGMLSAIALARVVRAVKESSGRDGSDAARLEQLSRKGFVAAIALLLSAVCLMATGSRAGGVISLVALVALVAWEVWAAARGGRTRVVAVTVGLGICAAVALAAGYLQGADERLERTVADGVSRMAVFSAHWSAFLERPWRGYGLGSFPAVNDLIQTSDTHHVLTQLNATHNVYLQWLEETGVFGALLMFGCIGCLLAFIFHALAQRARLRTWLRATLVMSGIVMIHGLVDYALQVPSIAWQWSVWLGVGCGLALASQDPARRRQRHQGAGTSSSSA